MGRFWFRAWLIVGLLGCAPSAPPNAPRNDTAWLQSLERWHAERNDEIGGPDGWVTLVTRSWLPEGASKVGSAATNDILLPADHAPPLVGTVVREGAHLRFVAAENVAVTVDGASKKEFEIRDDGNGHPTVWALGTLTFRVIKRQDRFALRVKDSAAPARASFKGLSFYPSNPAWRLRARLEAAPAGKTLRIINVLGQLEDMPSPGTLKFEVGGHTYALDAVTERGRPGLFLLFKDASSGHGTYPPGRFLYADAPAADGTVELDFNRAFSPPCAFTSFATCPLAPSQNQLSLRIEAGERYEGTHEMPVIPTKPEIVQTGNAVLRARAQEVPAEKITSPDTQALVKKMIATMRAAPGVGLAAPQIGIPLRVIVLEDRDALFANLTPEERRERERVAFETKTIFNPVLTKLGEEEATFFEGCLSVNGFMALVERSAEVEVTGLDENAQPLRWRVRGWPARILQHEVDHLDGTLYIDRMMSRSFSTVEQAKANYNGKSIAEIRRLLGL